MMERNKLSPETSRYWIGMHRISCNIGKRGLAMKRFFSGSRLYSSIMRKEIDSSQPRWCTVPTFSPAFAAPLLDRKSVVGKDAFICEMVSLSTSAVVVSFAASFRPKQIKSNSGQPENSNRKIYRTLKRLSIIFSHTLRNAEHLHQ